MSDSDRPSAEALTAAEQLLPHAWRQKPDYETVLSGVARALDEWRDKVRQAERDRIAAYLDFHEYDITSGVMDPLRALRRELGVKDGSS